MTNGICVAFKWLKENKPHIIKNVSTYIYTIKKPIHAHIQNGFNEFVKVKPLKLNFNLIVDNDDSGLPSTTFISKIQTNFHLFPKPISSPLLNSTSQPDITSPLLHDSNFIQVEQPDSEVGKLIALIVKELE